MTAKLDISSQVDRSEITIGDRIRYEIKVVYPKAGRLELPSVLGNLGAFEVKDYQASEPKDADGLRIQTWRFDLSTFTVGKYTLPPQIIEYREGTDTAATVYYTQPIEIDVKRTSPETVKDIADIAPPIRVEAPVPWLLYGLGAVVALAAGIVLWRVLRKKTQAQAAKPLLPPFDEAMEALDRLKDLALIRQNRAREFCFALSEILRRYLSRRYGIDALESTTSEFLGKAGTLPVTSAQKQWFVEFCGKTDPVKFANAMLLESEAGALYASVREFVRQTRPHPDETATAGSGPGAGGAPAAGEASHPSRPKTPPGGSAAKAGAAPKPPPGHGLIGGHGHDGNPDKGRPA